MKILPLALTLALAAFASAQQTFVSEAWSASERVRFRVEGALFGQGYGEWDGERDENTGLVATSVSAGMTVQLRGYAVSADVRHPLSQRTLTEGDAFTQGPTIVVSVGGKLR